MSVKRTVPAFTGAEAVAAACFCHGRSVCFYRVGDYQIAPKPLGERLWLVAANAALDKNRFPREYVSVSRSAGTAKAGVPCGHGV